MKIMNIKIYLYVNRSKCNVPVRMNNSIVDPALRKEKIKKQKTKSTTLLNMIAARERKRDREGR